MVMDTVMKINYIDYTSMSADTRHTTRLQISLPYSKSGLGITSLHDTAHSAYLASL